MILLTFMLSIKRLMSKRFYCVNKTQRWSRLGHTRAYKIISHDDRTAFFICFQDCLEKSEIAIKRGKTKLYQRKRGEIISMTYL